MILHFKMIQTLITHTTFRSQSN